MRPSAKVGVARGPALLSASQNRPGSWCDQSSTPVSALRLDMGFASLAEIIRRRFAEFGGVELELPPRDPIREISFGPEFDERVKEAPKKKYGQHQKMKKTRG